MNDIVLSTSFFAIKTDSRGKQTRLSVRMLRVQGQLPPPTPVTPRRLISNLGKPQTDFVGSRAVRISG